jgi:hypothetical protein
VEILGSLWASSDSLSSSIFTPPFSRQANN